MKVANKKPNGYSLVEVIVAAGIFALVIAGGIGGVRMGLHIVDNSRHYTRISQILQSELESLRALSWDELQALPLKSEIAIDPKFSTAAYDAYTLQRSIVVESVSLRRIEVLVQYHTRSGQAAALKYITFFSEGGVNDYYYRVI